MLAGFLPSTVSPVFHMLHLSSLFLHWFFTCPASMISLLVMALRSLRYLKKTRVFRRPHHPCQRKNMGVSKNRSTPKSSILIGFFHYKPSILGAHPYFWKHPYRLDEKCILCGMKKRNLFQSVSLFYSCKIQTKYQKTTAPLTNKLYNRSVDVNKDIHKRGICLPKGSSKVDRTVL